MDYTKIDTISSFLNRGEGNKVESGITVCSSEMPETRMFLVGYVGYYEDFDLDYSDFMPDMNASIRITRTKVRIGEKTHTIMKSVRMASENQKVEIDNFHKIGILEIVPECVEIMKRLNTGRLTKDYVCHKLGLVRRNIHADRFVYENDSLFYNTLPGDVILALEERQYIASDFLCLCRYTNPVTGMLSYNLFNPDDIILLSKKGE